MALDYLEKLVEIASKELEVNKKNLNANQVILQF
jgi:hypothetical protein